MMSPQGDAIRSRYIKAEGEEHLLSLNDNALENNLDGRNSQWSSIAKAPSLEPNEPSSIHSNV